MRGFLVNKTGLVLAFVAMGAIGLGLLSSTPAQAQGPKIAISSLELSLDDEGKVVLYGDFFDEPGLGAWTIDVYYNADLVNLVECGAEHGGICNPEFKSNAARITGSAAQGLTGEFVLGSLWFTCKGEGESGLELDIKVLADGTLGDPQPVEPEVRHGEIYCIEKHEDELLGDADCSGELTSLDASWILQYSAELVDAVPCPELADVNQDGYVDAVDATIVLQKVAGLIEK
ncbi:MAG: dockerin type I repeat-containing protein [Chloroflexi bacterium]|nr:dockerin type I repeat-containing protein [Chloroflexota bacterium]